MPRDLPLGNGALLVNFDHLYQLRDLYWPHVGEENHTAGHPFRFGVWVDGQFRWIDDAGWQRSLNYQGQSLVTEVILHHPALALTLHCHDVVDFHENLYLRQILVHNLLDTPREVRLFFAHDFHISASAIGDSAYYEPERRAVFHYKGKRWFMINCATGDAQQWTLGVDQWAVGVKEQPGYEGTWRDAEDGVLSGNAAVQGSVDSCVALHLQVPAHGETTGWYWIAVGEQFTETTRLNRAVRQRGPAVFLQRTYHYWTLWEKKEADDLSPLPDNISHLYQRSLLILRTQIDHDGAILAANDYEMARYYSDTYSYMWPRDGALSAAALIDAGYREASQRFFTFCHQIITPEGYLLHKFNPDGSLASSWHGWYNGVDKELPVQEDETALVLWALWRHFQRFHDVEFIKPLFRGLITRAANWLVGYRDEVTGLPAPSWNLWEERRGIFAWTTGAVWAGLHAAAQFSRAFGETELTDTYTLAAEAIRRAAREAFWDPTEQCYAAQVTVRDGEVVARDSTPESSCIGLWYFGMFPADDPGVIATMERIGERLWVHTPVGGIARYLNDYYYQVSHDITRIPGNPWFVCTLWLAQWHIARADSPEALAPAMDLLQWAARHALASGVMAEQVHPETGAPLSVSPLTWCHATFVLAVREYLAKIHGGPRYTQWFPILT